MGKNKLLTLVSSICLIVVLAALPFMGACAAPSPAPPTEAIELKFSTGFPGTEISVTGCLEPLAKDIEEATGGRVKTTLYVAGSLGSAMEQWDMVRTGGTDIAISCQAFHRGLFPLTSVIELPFLGITSAEEGSRVLWELYEKFPEIRAEYDDVKLLSIMVYAPNHVCTTKKPVYTMEDMAGLKLRCTGSVQAEMAKLFGASPVTMASPEIYGSLEKGVIDGLFFGLGGLYSFKVGEIIRYVTKCSLFVGPFFLAMNRDKWNSLPPDIQAIIDELTQERIAVEVSGKAWDAGDEVGWEFAKGYGAKMYELPDEELGRWRETVTPIYESWIQEMEDMGLPGRAVYEEAYRLAQQY